MKLKTTRGYQIIENWLASKGYKPFAYQEEAWQHINNGRSGLVNAPTGTGKTFSVFLGAVIQFINDHPETYQAELKNGLQLIWITPLRALAKDIGRAMEEVIFELDLSWKVGIRNGDTSLSERQKQKRQMPEVLITTPESMHLLLSQKGAAEIFKTVRLIAVDEWHELVGGKRGVLVELALSQIISVRGSMADMKSLEEQTTKAKRQTSNLSVWGISATIGNLEEAKNVLLLPLSLLTIRTCRITRMALLFERNFTSS
jgi:ATP-dependent Lhr-like helicase